MKPEDVRTIVEAFTAELPEAIGEALEHVKIYYLASAAELPADAIEQCSELGVRFGPEEPGMYLGTTIEGFDQDDSADADKPVGSVYLNAGQLPDEASVITVLLHEIGHALGLDEEEVADLGLSMDRKLDTPPPGGQT